MVRQCRIIYIKSISIKGHINLDGASILSLTIKHLRGANNLNLHGDNEVLYSIGNLHLFLEGFNDTVIIMVIYLYVFGYIKLALRVSIDRLTRLLNNSLGHRESRIGILVNNLGLGADSVDVLIFNIISGAYLKMIINADPDNGGNHSGVCVIRRDP